MALSFPQAYDSHVEDRMREFFKTLSEKDRRRFGALEAAQLGHGGTQYVAGVLGCSRRTIARGTAELVQLPDDPAEGRVRRPGAGRKKSVVRAGTGEKPSVRS